MTRLHRQEIPRHPDLPRKNPNIESNRIPPQPRTKELLDYSTSEFIQVLSENPAFGLQQSLHALQKFLHHSFLEKAPAPIRPDNNHEHFGIQLGHSILFRLGHSPNHPHFNHYQLTVLGHILSNFKFLHEYLTQQSQKSTQKTLSIQPDIHNSLQEPSKLEESFELEENSLDLPWSPSSLETITALDPESKITVKTAGEIYSVSEDFEPPSHFAGSIFNLSQTEQQKIWHTAVHDLYLTILNESFSAFDIRSPQKRGDTWWEMDKQKKFINLKKIIQDITCGHPNDWQKSFGKLNCTNQKELEILLKGVLHFIQEDKTFCKIAHNLNFGKSHKNFCN